MHSQWYAFIRGYVAIEVRGPHIEEWMNLLIESDTVIWDIRRINVETIEMHISITDFFDLRSSLKQTGSRVHVVKRHGLPFILNKVEKRKFFVVGFVGFVIGLYMLSSLVWQVNIEGNEQISKQQILEEAKKQGVYLFQWKYRLGNPDQISRELVKSIPGTAWVGVEI